MFHRSSISPAANAPRSIGPPRSSSATYPFVVPRVTTIVPSFRARFTDGRAFTPFAIRRLAAAGLNTA